MMSLGFGIRVKIIDQPFDARAAILRCRKALHSG
jgi:hypothetical protein